MKILITGICGFVGSTLTRALRRSLEIIGWNGRLWVVAVVLVWLFTAFLAMYSGHGNQVWRGMGVYCGSQSFGDARIVTLAWDHVRQGHGAYDELPGNQHFNYPRVWLLPGFLGLGEGHTVMFAGAGVFFFYLSVFLGMGRLHSAEVVIYILALCSPAAMLAVEKGNIDLFVFGLVSLGVVWAAKRRVLSTTVLWLAAVLKLFPIFALPICLREKKRRGFTVLAIAGFGFLLYLLATLPDIVQIRTLTPRPTLFGFGCMTAVDGITKWLHQHGYENHLTAALRWLAFSMALIIALFAGWFGLNHRRQNVPPTGTLDAFRAGALIYLGVFLIGNNYEYRLIFLFLCLGQLLMWIRDDREFRPLARVVVLSLLVSVWEFWPLSNQFPGCNLIIPIAQTAHWTLFAFLTWLVAATLPDWLVATGGEYLPQGQGRQRSDANSK
jgi:hypothetical protein